MVFESALAEDVSRYMTTGLITTVPGTGGAVSFGPLTVEQLRQFMALLLGPGQATDGPPYTHTVNPADPVDDDGNQMQGAVPSLTIVDEPFAPGRVVAGLDTPDVPVSVPVPPEARSVDVYINGTRIGSLDGQDWNAWAYCPDHQPAPTPADPMLRAIEAKRHRNTGPKPQQRAPRRIDPRRSR